MSTIGIILVAWLLFEVALRLAKRALDRRRSRWLASLPEGERAERTHLVDQMDALQEQVGPWAMFCRMRYATLLVTAEDLPAGPQRSEQVARALRWEARAERWRRDRKKATR